MLCPGSRADRPADVLTSRPFTTTICYRPDYPTPRVSSARTKREYEIAWPATAVRSRTAPGPPVCAVAALGPAVNKTARQSSSHGRAAKSRPAWTSPNGSLNHMEVTEDMLNKGELAIVIG